METKSPQFTAYDILGYLVPGLAFFALVDSSMAFHYLGMKFTYVAITGRYLSIPWQASIPLMLVSYYLGHLISFGNYSGAKSSGLAAKADWMESIRLTPCLRDVDR